MKAAGVRVALVEDHDLLATTLGIALEIEGMEVLRARLDGRGELRAQLSTFRPHVALIDLDLGPLGDGGQLIPDLVADGVRVIVVSGTTDDADLGRCLAFGAIGCVPKRCGLHELIAAVEGAAVGQSNLSPRRRTDLIAIWQTQKASREDGEERLRQLTPREAEILARLMDGMTVERIAVESVVSAGTVRTQVKSILAKLGVNSQLQAVALASRAGWAARGPDQPS